MTQKVPNSMLVSPGGGATTFAGLTDAATADIPGTNTLTAAALSTLTTNANGRVSKAGDTMTGPLVLSGDASAALNPVTLQQMQAAVIGVGKRARARVTTTATLTIATALVTGQVLNGVTLAAGDLVLVKDQSTGAQNGVYVAGTTPARAAEFDTWAEFPGSVIAVYEGTVSGDTLWFCTNNDGGTLGTTAIVFTQFTGAAGALLAVNNLSDVANAATARANLSAAPSTGIANAALATMAATTVKGNATGSTATPTDISYSSLAAGLATFLGLSGASLSSFALTSGNNEGILPSSIGATTWATFGTGAPTVIGTATVQTFNTTSIQLREAAYNYATLTATAGLKSGVQGLNKIYLPSSTVAGPDVKVDIKAMVTDATASCRGFMGLGAGSAPNIDAGDPSGRNNMIGLWHDAADTFWQLGVTTSGGVATKVATTIPVSTLNHKLWVRIRVKGFPTNTYYIEVWDNDVFQQSATFTYAQGGTIQAVAAYAYRANAANAVITAVSVYGMASSSFSTVGDGGSPFTVIPYSTNPTINYANGADYDLTLTASTIAGWTESGLTDGLSWNMVIRQDATGGRTVPVWPPSWLFENAGSVPPIVPVTALSGHTLASGIYHAALGKNLVSFVQAS